ncbi:hypothetical protein ACT6QH_12775 [Xanthobacter sp. TB0139]
MALATLLAVGSPVLAGRPVQAQTMQFLGITPPSEQTVGPFSGSGDELLQPGAQGQETRMGPHTVLPEAPEGKVALGLFASFGEGKKPISRGVVWRVFAAQPDTETGAFPLVAEQDGAAPVFFLSPGSYIVHASYGQVSMAKELSIGQLPVREEFALPAGGLRLKADVKEQPISTQLLTFDIFEGSFLQGRASSQPYYKGAAPGEVVLLPEGTYHVVSTYGDANAVVSADVNVVPGKLTDATMHHRAAEVSMTLVRDGSSKAVQNTQWTIITPGGDTIKESISAEPTFVLSEGIYTAIGRYNGTNYSREFKVEAGNNQRIAVKMKAEK